MSCSRRVLRTGYSIKRTPLVLVFTPDWSFRFLCLAVDKTDRQLLSLQGFLQHCCPHLFLYVLQCWQWAPGHFRANTLRTKCGKPCSGPEVKFVYKSLNFVASVSLCLWLWKFPHKGHYTIHKLQLSPSSERLKQVFLNSFHFTLVKHWKEKLTTMSRELCCLATEPQFNSDLLQVLSNGNWQC